MLKWHAENTSQHKLNKLEKEKEKEISCAKLVFDNWGLSIGWQCKVQMVKNTTLQKLIVPLHQLPSKFFLSGVCFKCRKWHIKTFSPYYFTGHVTPHSYRIFLIRIGREIWGWERQYTYLDQYSHVESSQVKPCRKQIQKLRVTPSVGKAIQ